LIIAILGGSEIEIKIVMPRYSKTREINVIFQFLKIVEDIAEIMISANKIILNH
jgi:hypothetical protein